MTFWRRIFFVLSTAVLGITAALALQICEQCGRELKEGDAICAHCKAPAPESKAKAAEVKQAVDQVSSVAASVVEEEVLAAREQANKGDPEVALLLLKNAASLNLLLDGTSAVEKTKRIQELMDSWKKAVPSTTAVACPACNGTGKKTMTVTSMKTGKTESVEAYGMVCVTCRGAGKTTRASTIEERKISLAQAGKRMVELQRTRRMEALGGAWLPLGSAESLSNKEKATVRNAAAAPCAECLGIGRADCTKCNGKGRVKCENSQCKEGQITVTVQGQLVKGQLTRSDPCKDCGGSGRIACPACAGSGSIACKVCKGSGERASCARCGGQGAEACRKCNGSGKSDDGGVCPVCKGQAMELCQTCHGDGKK